ncbi:hypothetical protein BD626DRAFT_520401 [Schizophyllum amplum]|uniref:HotDog domain-containing protein n=1 Tax=Schizophyllum amplum TaxID=97359 RepID=A0A550BUJ8_9AGAR|nr:hypothetical protein BD626DRAFT_520401 [Auriculariopsis ampla]
MFLRARLSAGLKGTSFARLRTAPAHRLSFHSDALAHWIDAPKEAKYEDTPHVERLADLFATLPTRDGTRKPYEALRTGEQLPHGHHLAFFYPRSPEGKLRPDGTDGAFCPPPPFVRRMWAGGSMSWDNARPLRVGEPVTAVAVVDEGGVQVKAGAEGKTGAGLGATTDVKAEARTKVETRDKPPMVFVNQHIAYTPVGERAPAVVERRSHVFLPGAALPRGGKLRPAPELPAPEFSFEYCPTATTLFRFSALTFNAHHIHLDKEYARAEGYKDRLVHGPLTALMLLETLAYNFPAAQPAYFEYRARNPLVVGRACTIFGAWNDERTALLWCVDENGVVGMTGTIVVEGR